VLAPAVVSIERDGKNITSRMVVQSPDGRLAFEVLPIRDFRGILIGANVELLKPA
jgi:hypothetical protein